MSCTIGFAFAWIRIRTKSSDLKDKGACTLNIAIWSLKINYVNLFQYETLFILPIVW